jgi:hypothetical protein
MSRRLPLLCLLLPAAVFSSAAGAATIQDTLTTFVIGAPFPQLPLCADVRTPDGGGFKSLCSDKLSSTGSMRSIGFPANRLPDVMDGNAAVAVVEGPTLVGLIVPTKGAQSDASVLQALTTAFGKPMRTEQEDVRTRDGKAAKATHAGWVRKGVTVEMYAIPDQPDTGTIEILMPQARPLMDGTVAQTPAQPGKKGAPSGASAASATKAAKPASAPKGW